MSDQLIRDETGRSREFVPEVKALEDRILLSPAAPRAEHIVWHPNPPRTGGIAVQNGGVLSCFVGQPRTNQVQVSDDGKGNVEMSWNSGPTHSFSGVSSVVIQAERAKTDQFVFKRGTGNDTVTARVATAGSTFAQPGPSSGSTAVSLAPTGPTDVAPRGEGSHTRGHLHPRSFGGHAVQTGTTLTITVNRPTTNVVQLTDEGAGKVEVEWNGGPAHSYSGVSTIMVNTHNARRDQITLIDAAH